METRDSTPVPSICCDTIWWFLWWMAQPIGDADCWNESADPIHKVETSSPSWDILGPGSYPCLLLQDQTSSSLPKKKVCSWYLSPCLSFFFCLSDVFPRIQHMVSSFLCKGRIWISIGMFISFWHTIPLSWTGCSWGSCYFIYHCGPKQLALSIPDEQNREAILENLDSALVELWTLKIS